MADDEMIPKWVKRAIYIGAPFVLLLFTAILFRGCCVDFVDSYELGYKYDSRNGQLSRIDHTGYVVHPPMVVEIHTVDLRPMQVCINANSRVLNCKLVEFNQAGLEVFLSWHGRAEYTASALNDILKSYAYDGSGKSYPFLHVIRELKPEEAARTAGPPK